LAFLASCDQLLAWAIEAHEGRFARFFVNRPKPMKKTKEQPGSLAGLLLIVTGMLLLSTVLLIFSGNGSPVGTNGRSLIVMSCAAVLALGAGSFLSARHRK